MTGTDSPDTRKCNKCGRWFPLTEAWFYHAKSDNGRKYFEGRCKTCRNEYRNRWRARFGALTIQKADDRAARLGKPRGFITG